MRGKGGKMEPSSCFVVVGKLFSFSSFSPTVSGRK